MFSKIKLLLLIPHLGGGGAEQVTAQLALHLDPHRFDIHLATVSPDHAGVPLLPSSVAVHRLKQRRVRRAWRQIVRLIRNLQPDVLFSGMAHLSFLVLALRPLLPRRTRVLIRQNTTASAAATTRLHRLAYRALYPSADGVLCQSEAMADDLARHFSISRSKCWILPNPVDVLSIRAAAQSARNKLSPQLLSAPRLLCVSRFSREKGLDLLLHALVDVLQTFPAVSLTVLGDGPLQSDLQDLARNLGIEYAVSFPGFSSDLPLHYAQSTLFVLPSRYEGMPNALLEAAAAQLPIVATPASRGLSDLLSGRSGIWLTASITAESVAETILLALKTLQSICPAPALFDHSFLAPFETSQSIAAYSSCFEEAAAKARA